MFFVCSRLMAQLESKGQDFKLHANPTWVFERYLYFCPPGLSSSKSESRAKIMV